MLTTKPYLRSISLKDEEVRDKEAYPFNIPSIQMMDRLEFHPDVTFLVGENGSGKSTLIEGIALALGFGIEGGTKNVQIKTHDNASPLYQYLRLVNGLKKPNDYYFLRAESYYNVATYLEEVDKEAEIKRTSLHKCSHGESFMITLTERLRGNGLYIFDEPEAALSPNRQLAALAAIHQLVEKKSQFIIATHSPILLAYPHARIFRLGEEGLTRVAYEETDHYQTTLRFLSDYKQMVRELLK